MRSGNPQPQPQGVARETLSGIVTAVLSSQHSCSASCPGPGGGSLWVGQLAACCCRLLLHASSNCCKLASIGSAMLQAPCSTHCALGQGAEQMTAVYLLKGFSTLCQNPPGLVSLWDGNGYRGPGMTDGWLSRGRSTPWRARSALAWWPLFNPPGDECLSSKCCTCTSCTSLLLGVRSSLTSESVCALKKGVEVMYTS